MRIFRSLLDVENPPLPPEMSALIHGLVVGLFLACEPYDPDADGFVVLMEEADDPADLSALSMPYGLESVPFEAVEVDEETGCYLAVFLANNQFGLTFVVPDAPWLPPGCRDALEAQRDFT